MELGHLKIPKPEIERFAFVHDIQTRVYVQYANLIERTDVGKKVLSMLRADPRVENLDGKMVSSGSSATRFDVKALAMWFLWAVNEYGQKIAEQSLNRFLDSETIPVINTLWVLGVEIEQLMELDNGYRIVPIHDMPDSREKEHYLMFDMHHMMQRNPSPKAAITYTCNVLKAETDDMPLSPETNKEFWVSLKRLSEIALLLNALDNVSCVPHFSTSYTDPTMPIGLFSGSGGGSFIYDVFGYKSTKLSMDTEREIKSLIKAFGKLQDAEKTRITRILSRLSQSKRREQIEDKILDLGICLEMALLGDNRNNDQLSLSFRLRGSWLLGNDKEERMAIYCQLREIYNYRSQVAHSGILCGNNAEKIKKVHDAFTDYSSLAERIIRSIITNGNPEWISLILNTI